MELESRWNETMAGHLFGLWAHVDILIYSTGYLSLKYIGTLGVLPALTAFYLTLSGVTAISYVLLSMFINKLSFKFAINHTLLLSFIPGMIAMPLIQYGYVEEFNIALTTLGAMVAQTVLRTISRSKVIGVAYAVNPYTTVRNIIIGAGMGEATATLVLWLLGGQSGRHAARCMQSMWALTILLAFSYKRFESIFHMNVAQQAYRQAARNDADTLAGPSTVYGSTAPTTATTTTTTATTHTTTEITVITTRDKVDIESGSNIPLNGCPRITINPDTNTAECIEFETGYKIVPVTRQDTNIFTLIYGSLPALLSVAYVVYIRSALIRTMFTEPISFNKECGLAGMTHIGTSIGALLINKKSPHSKTLMVFISTVLPLFPLSLCLSPVKEILLSECDFSVHLCIRFVISAISTYTVANVLIQAADGAETVADKVKLGSIVAAFVGLGISNALIQQIAMCLFYNIHSYRDAVITFVGMSGFV